MNTLVRLDKVKATAHIVSFTFDSDLENGRIVALGDLELDGETYKAAAPINVTSDRLVLHASVPMNYNEPDIEDEFILKAGQEGRGYILERGDIVTITDDGFTSDPEKGDFVVPANGETKLTVTAEPAEEKIVFKVIAKEFLNGRRASVLEVL